MRITLALPIIALAGLTLPAQAQNIFQPLQDMVEQLSPRSQPRPRAAVPEPAAAPEEAPVPEIRPEGLTDEAPESGVDAEVVEPEERLAVEPEIVAPVEEPGLPRPRPEVSVEVAPVDVAPAEDEAVPEMVEPEPDAEPPAEEGEPSMVPEPQAEARVYQTACPAVLNGLVEAEALPPLAEGMCGEKSPISVTAILSRGRMVPLSSPMVTNCEMASALPDWVEAVDNFALATAEVQIETINAGTSYMCRARVGGSSEFTSEHGFANAVDVTGFTLTDGRTISVLEDFLPASAPAGRLLHYAHDAACSRFTTVLGPEANAEHKDHFHFDLGCHGQSCTARICE